MHLLKPTRQHPALEVPPAVSETATSPATPEVTPSQPERVPGGAMASGSETTCASVLNVDAAPLVYVPFECRFYIKFVRCFLLFFAHRAVTSPDPCVLPALTTQRAQAPAPGPTAMPISPKAPGPLVPGPDKASQSPSFEAQKLEGPAARPWASLAQSSPRAGAADGHGTPFEHQNGSESATGSTLPSTNCCGNTAKQKSELWSFGESWPRTWSALAWRSSQGAGRGEPFRVGDPEVPRPSYTPATASWSISPRAE